MATNSALCNGVPRSIPGALLLIAVLGFTLSLGAQDWTQRVDPGLLALRPDDTAKVIVRLKPSAGSGHNARFTERGAQLRHELKIVHSSAYEVPASALAE